MPNTMKRKHKQIVAHILTTARAEESARALRSERVKRAAATRRANRLKASHDKDLAALSDGRSKSVSDNPGPSGLAGNVSVARMPETADLSEDAKSAVRWARSHGYEA